MSTDHVRRLIVNADDFGQSFGINAGVIRTHRDGIVTSASLMVRWPAAPEAADYARAHPELSVGLHVDLGEWTAVDGDWFPRYQVVDTEDRAAVENEVTGQLDRFRRLLGRDPTHLDGHQHVQRSGHPEQAMRALAEELGIVVRDRTDKVTYLGDFYGRTATEPFPEGITVARLCALIAGLEPGWTELGCHPGLYADVESDYLEERAGEVEALCDPRVRKTIENAGVELQSFSAVRS